MEKLFNKKNGKRLLQAILTSYILYYIMAYILNGEFHNPLEMLSVEFLFVALYMSVTFLVLTYISSYFNGISYRRQQTWLIRFLELLLVIVVGIALNYILFIVPTKIRYGNDIMLQQPDGRTRLIYALHLIVALVYYYFVERIQTHHQLKEIEIESEKLQKENSQAQLMALKNQINPHFLFNSFNILDSLIELDPPKAQEFLEKLSNIYRVFLENINKDLITLEEELQVMESYKALLQTRFQSHLEIRIDIKKEDKKLLIPPGVSQMLMENAIKHNGFNKNQPLCIDIHSSNGYLVVKNNKQKRNEPSTSTGIGLKNIKSRYQLQSKEAVIIENEVEDFTVKVPLIKRVEV
ncbi:histidine kinase [Marivirga sp. S37H4]|uniref:Histidine kinase n=1 Tax=Marivirga aurantiaca TaxID=2802615 RepID=A0A935CAL0_9BACT|nr:histidine kinase [Marivirga aurantiaca]MBK6266831.1 histidine kinase [Marivirga aurantiaca]